MPAHSTPTIVREANAGATLATLLYPPWPVRYRPARVRGYALSGQPVRPPSYVVALAWGYVPNALLAQLWALPTDRPTEWFLPVPGPGGVNQVWGWVKGHLVRPDGDLATWTRAEWDQQVWQLQGAYLV